MAKPPRSVAAAGDQAGLRIYVGVSSLAWFGPNIHSDPEPPPVCNVEAVVGAGVGLDGVRYRILPYGDIVETRLASAWAQFSSSWR